MLFQTVMDDQPLLIDDNSFQNRFGDELFGQVCHVDLFVMFMKDIMDVEAGLA